MRYSFRSSPPLLPFLQLPMFQSFKTSLTFKSALFALFFVMLSNLLLQAEEAQNTEDEATKENSASVKEVSPGVFQIGQVTFNQKNRRISFPTTLNMSEGLLEFAIVHIDGKIHESLLSTTVSAFNLNLALKLLRYPESPELFQILDEDFRQTGRYPEVSEEVKTGARVKILVSWEADGKKHENLINDWIYHSTLEKAMPATPWLNHGSYVYENQFKAEVMGELVAIFLSRSSIFNFAGEDNHIDEPWIVFSGKVPPAGTPVTVTIAPLLEK